MKRLHLLISLIMLATASLSTGAIAKSIELHSIPQLNGNSGPNVTDVDCRNYGADTLVIFLNTHLPDFGATWRISCPTVRFFGYSADSNFVRKSQQLLDHAMSTTRLARREYNPHLVTEASIEIKTSKIVGSGSIFAINNKPVTSGSSGARYTHTARFRSDGRHGGAGRNAACRVETRGIKITVRNDRSTPGGNGQRGGAGEDGSPGRAGTHGDHGSSGPRVKLIVGSFEGSAELVIVTLGQNGGHGGHGGNGQQGGKGSKGGNGGKGGNAASCHSASSGGHGAPGGNGGRGGNGGSGGNGGNGGNGGDVLIQGTTSSVKHVKIFNEGGAGGQGGQGGTGGRGGTAGLGGQPGCGGSGRSGPFARHGPGGCGTNGTPGQEGAHGQRGKAGPDGKPGQLGQTSVPKIETFTPSILKQRFGV